MSETSVSPKMTASSLKLDIWHVWRISEWPSTRDRRHAHDCLPWLRTDPARYRGWHMKGQVRHAVGLIKSHRVIISPMVRAPDKLGLVDDASSAGDATVKVRQATAQVCKQMKVEPCRFWSCVRKLGIRHQPSGGMTRRCYCSLLDAPAQLLRQVLVMPHDC